MYAVCTECTCRQYTAIRFINPVVGPNSKFKILRGKYLAQLYDEMRVFTLDDTKSLTRIKNLNETSMK
jgi:hypothetical protein